ncbi:MAG: CBS domain-containing protein [Desulfurococcales archaeon]|nr:CBS domain-containing protein [Desulfurococcales archaeon]
MLLHTLSLSLKEIKDSYFLELKPDYPLTKARREFRKYAPRIALVTDERQLLSGIIYRATIITLTSTKSNLYVRSLMERPKILVESLDNAPTTLKLMVDEDEWTVPLINKDGNPTGTISLEAFIRWIYGNRLLKEKLSKNKVSEVMSSTNLIYVTQDNAISHTIRKLVKEKFAGLPVVDSKLKCIGILTQYDILRKRSSGIVLDSESGPARNVKVKEIMSTPAITVKPSQDLWRLIEIMASTGFGRIPVTEEHSKLVGIIDRSDITRFILEDT